MLRNYFIIAWRNLWRHPVHTGTNILGLAIGLACCILIVEFVVDELSYDRFHEKSNRIHRVVNVRTALADGQERHLALTPASFAPTMKYDFPEVEASLRLFDFGEMLVRRGEKRFFEPKVYMADSTIFDIFSMPLVMGDPDVALRAPGSAVISERLAEKYFDGENPLGKTLRVGDYDVTVTGISKNLPRQSHVDLNLLISFSTLTTFSWASERLSSWIWQQFYTYILLEESADPAVLEAKFPDFVERNASAALADRGFTYTPYLQPLTDIYLRSSHLEFDWAKRGKIEYLYIFSGVALFVLLIAGFNYMNLSTARALHRAREVGLRKVVGARRSQLVSQFLGESTATAVVALGLAILTVEAARPVFNSITGKELALSYGHVGVLLALLSFAILVGLIAGSYPAFFLSAFRPSGILRGTSESGGPGMSGVRRALVVGQFTISIALIIGTAVVYEQLAYVQQADIGLDRDLVLKMPLRGDMGDKIDAIKGELERNKSVVSSTVSWGSPGSFEAGDGIKLPGADEEWPTKMYTVDYDFIETYGMELIAGRDFDKSRPSDEQRAFLLNETSVRELGWTAESAIGRRIRWDIWGGDGVKEGEVIGVVRDFNFKSLHHAVEPLVIHIFPNYGQLSVKIRPDDVQSTLAYLEQQWGIWAPDWPFEYEFLDEQLAEQYANDEKLARIVGVFTFLAILIACLGLFGLASFVAERRTREIGIRKVLGASVKRLVILLSAEFTLLIGVAFLIGAPVAYLAARSWLENFTYRISIPIEIFLGAGLAALSIALLTISYHTIRTATSNPVKSLRTD